MNIRGVKMEFLLGLCCIYALIDGVKLLVLIQASFFNNKAILSIFEQFTDPLY